MKYIFKFPDIGEGLEEGRIVEWLVKKGQEIHEGDMLVTMETDKVVTEIPSPKTGTISKLYGSEGGVINVGDALVEIEIEGTAEDEAESEQKQEVVEEKGAGVVGTIEEAGTGAVLSSSNEGLSEEQTKERPKRKKALATPVARAMAKDFGIDINEVKGTGPAGRVMKADIKRFAENGSSAKKTVDSQKARTDEPQRTEVEKLSQIRKTIAKNMRQSKHKAAHMTVFDDAEISELDRIRKKYKAEYGEKGIKLTYLAFVVKALTKALQKHKALNSEMDEENDLLIYKKYYNIGIAVDTEKGLVVPVIKAADKLSISETAQAIQQLAEKATKGNLTMDDFKDGTFTITSYGSIGGKYAAPVINYPQAGILGIGRISEQPVVKDGEISIGKLIPLSVAVDHRIVDGGEVTRFLNSMIYYLSDPVSLLMD
jgi:pyruvate dehydrogenase E2 component (dihydrolipoamide acetyltransferase)